MNKRWLRKTVILLMAMTMLFSVIGCDKRESGKDEPKKLNTKELTYHANTFEINGIYGDVEAVFFQDGRIYISTYEWIEKIGNENSAMEEEGSEEKSKTKEEGDEEEIENADEIGARRLYSVNADGDDLKEIIMPELGQDEWLQSVAIGKDNSIIYLINAYDKKAEQVSYFLIEMDKEGNLLTKEDITKLLDLSEDSYIRDVFVDDKGRVVIATERIIHIFAEDYKSISDIKLESFITGITKTKDGKIICGMSVVEGNNSIVQVKELDVDGKKWGKTYNLDLAYFNGSDSLIQGIEGVEYDFYYRDDSGIYGYDMALGETTKLLDYIASDITTENLYRIVPIAEDAFLFNVHDDNGLKLIKYNKEDASIIEDKTVITFGVMWVDDIIKKQVIEFNKNSKEYRIEFKDYSDEEDSVTKMNADIVAGNVPDIMLLSDLPYEQYIAKGMLEDLTPYFEKDKELNTEDIVDSVFEAIKVDDKVYYIAPSFEISTIVARTSDVGNRTGWTFDEMKAVLEEKGDSVRPFYSENKSDMLYSLLENGINDFVEWETGECSFDSQNFKEILEICNKGTIEETDYSDDAPSMPSLVRNNKILFVEGRISPDIIQVYKKMYNGDITYIGYPNKEKTGSYFQFDNQLGIYAKSEVKEGAWDFIRSFMTKEYQGNMMNLNNTPTRKDCFDMMVMAKTTTKEYKDELGQEVYPMESSWSWGDLEVMVTPLSQDEMDMYVGLVKNTKKTSSNDDAMMEIVQEEEKAYFIGEKSLDETAKIIQNRIKTYVNENR